MGSSVALDDIGVRLSKEDADFQRGNIADLLHRPNLSFPGAQPVSFAKIHLEKALLEKDFFLCEKTDGIRCLLFLTEISIDGERVEAQFLIDRKNDYYYVPRDTLHLPRPDNFASYHKGTILDGELVRQSFRTGEQRLAYLIFDCLAIDGDDVTAKTFDKRLARVDKFLAEPFKAFAKKYPDDVAAQPFQVEMKAMEFSYGIEMMFRDRIPRLPHGNDGLIFTCKDARYTAGTDQNIVKWKPPHENTIDFRLLLGDFPMMEDDDGQFEDFDAKPEFELHVNQNHGDRGAGYKLYAYMNVTDEEWTAMKGMNQELDGRIIECYRDPAQGWRPKTEKDGTPRFRDDKKDANHISTVESVIESIQDAVTEDDLIRAAADIRREYKKRLQKKKEEEERMKMEQEAERKRRDEQKRKEEEERRKNAGETKEDDSGPTYED